MAQPLSGRNPLSYLGVEAVTPPNMIVSPTSPTPTDTKNVTVGDMWINRNTQNFYVLTSLAGGRATWTQVEGSAANQFETDDSNIAVPVGGLLIIHGGTGITTSSSGNTVTITATGGSGINTLDGDSGSATGSTVTIAGGTGITTSASGSTVTITASGGGGVTLNGDSSTAAGSTINVITGFTSGPYANGTIEFVGDGVSTLTLNTTDGNSNTGIGTNSLAGLFSAGGATNNTAFGNGTLSAISSGSSNSAFGTGALASVTSGGNNTAFGNAAGLTISTGSFNTFVGGEAGITVGGSNHTGIGWQSLANLTNNTYSDNAALGYFTLNGLAAGSFNIAIGSSAGSNLAGGTASNSNIYLNNLGIASPTHESNVLRIGAGTGSGTQQLASAFISGIQGVNVGSVASVVSINGDQLGTTTITAGSGISVTPGANTVTIAATGGAGITTLDGDSGSATGSTVTLTTGGATAEGTALFTGSGATMTLTFSGANNNTAIGHSAFANAGGQQNTLFGTIAGQFMSGGGSDANTCIGFESGNAINSGGQNTFLGAITNCSTSGSRNLALGYQAGNNLGGTENDNILISSLGTSSESNALHIGRGTGTGSFQLNKAFVSGIQGITVTGTAVLVSASDQLGIAVSSRRFKSDIQDMKDDSSALYKLRPVSFIWDKDSAPGLKDATDLRQFGLIAEEAASIIPHAVNLDKDGQPLNINYQDLIGMMINEIQRLNKRIEALEAK